MTRPPRHVFAFVLVCLSVTSQVSAQGNSRKLDQAVRSVLKATPNAAQRVIVTARPGYRAAVKQALKSRGATILGENATFNVVTARVAGPDITRFSDDPAVADISSDSLVQTNAAPGSGSSAAAAVSAVRETLGLSSTAYTGNGIGVA